MAVFIGSTRRMEASAGWRDTALLSLHELSEYDEAVRARFTKPNIMYLGSHTGCSCGFSYGDVEVENDEEVEQERLGRRSVECLRQLVEEELAAGGEVELFASWEGEWTLPPVVTEEVSPEHFGGEQFRFPERSFYVVRRAA